MFHLHEACPLLMLQASQLAADAVDLLHTCCVWHEGNLTRVSAYHFNPEVSKFGRPRCYVRQPLPLPARTAHQMVQQLSPDRRAFQPCIWLRFSICGCWVFLAKFPREPATFEARYHVQRTVQGSTVCRSRLILAYLSRHEYPGTSCNRRSCSFCRRRRRRSSLTSWTD